MMYCDVRLMWYIRIHTGHLDTPTLFPPHQFSASLVTHLMTTPYESQAALKVSSSPHVPLWDMAWGGGDKGWDGIDVSREIALGRTDGLSSLSNGRAFPARP